MNGVPFSFEDFEATFGPELCERRDREVAAAPRFSPETRERYRALFASIRVTRPADPEADAA